MTKYTPEACPHRDRHGTTPSGCSWCGFDPVVQHTAEKDAGEPMDTARLATLLDQIEQEADGSIAGSTAPHRDVERFSDSEFYDLTYNEGVDDGAAFVLSRLREELGVLPPGGGDNS